MNVAKLELDGSEYDRLYIEICRRIEHIIGKEISYNLAIAVMHLLVDYHIRFKDGFEINSSSEPSSELWVADAAAIAAALCTEVDKDCTWFKWSYNLHTNSNQDFEVMLRRLIEQVRNSPDTEVVECI